MNPTLRKLMLLASALFVTAGLLTACGGGGDEDPDFDGPEVEGECPPTLENMHNQIEEARRANVPPPPFDQLCPDMYADYLKGKR